MGYRVPSESTIPPNRNKYKVNLLCIYDGFYLNSTVGGFAFFNIVPPGGHSDDDDNDSVPNLLEYVFGGDPSQPGSNIAPAITVSGGNFVFIFPRADASETADIGLAVEAGNDLAIWQEIYNIGPGVPSAGVSIQENAAAPDTITVTFPLNTATFARLRVTVSQ